ncbi:MAG: CPXCG motif-containing cysteine-rich protein [Pseudomonadota bacterium]|nr:CPXCG motif-containing cysteine-rich protein [Pseudomonadota bacterium]
MSGLEEKQIECPYCGEALDVLIDCSVPQQRYIEDCQVCCQPINFDVSVDQKGDSTVLVTTDDE